MRLIRLGFAILAGLLTVPAVGADSSGGNTVCMGRYALCSSAKCKAIDGDANNVSCACEGPLNGQNVGDSLCADRQASLTSTFSLWDPTKTPFKAAKSVLSCTGANAAPWAFCLDAPCATVNGVTTCTCKIKPASAYATFTAACPINASARQAACAQLWSGASPAELAGGYKELASKVKNPPKLKHCKVK